MLQNDPLHHTLREFFDRGQRIHYKKGELILRPQEAPDGVFFVLDGFIKVYTVTEKGAHRILTIHKPTEIFPLLWAPEDQIEPDTFYQALSAVTVNRVPTSLLRSSMNNNILLTKAILKQFTTMLLVYGTNLNNLMQTRAKHRIISRLLFMSERFGLPSNKNIIIDVPLSHQDIADSVNVSRETASRELERLARLGLIEQRNSVLIIKDKDSLQKELDVL